MCNLSDNLMYTPCELYERGKVYLLSGEPYESLRAFAKGLQISLKEQDIEMAFNSIIGLTNQDQVLGYDWVQKLLLIGLAVKFPTVDSGKDAIEQLKNGASTRYQPLVGPIVIVAGGSSTEVEAQMCTYQGFILEAFRDFKGTIISGGTTAGASGLVGGTRQNYPTTIRTIGYLPRTKIHLVDKRYSEIRFTDSNQFSPLEPLQYWIDILASGIVPSDVKLLGINGGKISAFEYRMALAFGAKVGIVKGSGKEADNLLLDKDWNTSKNLIELPSDPSQGQAFVQLAN